MVRGAIRNITITADGTVHLDPRATTNSNSVHIVSDIVIKKPSAQKKAPKHITKEEFCFAEICAALSSNTVDRHRKGKYFVVSLNKNIIQIHEGAKYYINTLSLGNIVMTHRIDKKKTLQTMFINCLKVLYDIRFLTKSKLVIDLSKVPEFLKFCKKLNRCLQ